MVNSQTKKFNKLIPHKLSGDNQIKSLIIANCLMARNSNESFINCIVICNEKWVDCGSSGQLVESVELGGTV